MRMKHEEPLGVPWLILLAVVGIVCISFLAGVSHAMDKADHANAVERMRVYCKDAPLSMICLNPKTKGLQP